MRTICICNQKGGVAKTTTAVNLAAILARDFGKRVLVIDADSQGNATSFLGGDKSRPGMAALLQGAPMVPLQLTNTGTGMQLIAASDELMDLDLTKAGEGKLALGCLRDLRQYLETQPLPFDYCLVDCPPAFNAASSAALIAADAVLIPVKLDAFALEGMTNLMRQIQNMRRINPGLQLLGVLPVMWYRSDTITKAESALRNAGLKVLPRIRRSDRVDDMTYHQQPLIVCSPGLSGAGHVDRGAGTQGHLIRRGWRRTTFPSRGRQGAGAAAGARRGDRQETAGTAEKVCHSERAERAEESPRKTGGSFACGSG